ncbi:DNA ligase [Trypanosoma rangeli]|uniref:DNA ligase n=1 Tax=Trypanosoma rangeli TaxID=5698 RepID=A0A422NIS8_TRYRA|nr:DNA ligase [Trypanosoma rangeli]RNF05357.1 DNA ligase [Trypanosoma rangeli]|eukprot:RNF05357.1 DNA ligase [Trypanosoma rangeli]
MWRRWSCVLLATPAPMNPSLLFGAGRPRTKEQATKYQEMKSTSIQAAFPHLAACWVGPCWGTVMLTPNHISPVCTKIAVWRCSECLQEFEMSVAKFIDQHGVCPLCKKPQRKPEAMNKESEKKGGGAPAAVETNNGDAGSEAAAAPLTSMMNEVEWVKAPRMVHTNYKSVLHDNPEWEDINIQPMLAQKWESVTAQLLNPGPGEEKELLLASPKIDGIRCLIGYNKRQKEPQFFSRGGILLECCHGLVPHVMPLFEADPTLLLDGELFAPLCNFEELNGLVRRLAKFTTPEMRERQAQLLEYFSFDIMHSAQLSAPNAPFSERYQLLKKMIPICGAKRISAYQHDEEKRKIIRRKTSARQCCSGRGGQTLPRPRGAGGCGRDGRGFGGGLFAGV